MAYEPLEISEQIQRMVAVLVATQPAGGGMAVLTRVRKLLADMLGPGGATA